MDSMKLECFDCGCKNIIKATNKGLCSKVFFKRISLILVELILCTIFAQNVEQL